LFFVIDLAFGNLDVGNVRSFFSNKNDLVQIPHEKLTEINQLIKKRISQPQNFK
jgi:hypothetical protein